MNHVSDMTKGNIPKIILTFFVPMFLTNLLQQLYTFVDSVIVGKGLGDMSLAAVGNMNSLNFLIVGFSMGLAGGFTIIIAQFFGAGNYEKLKEALAVSLELILAIGVILTIFSSIFLRKIMILMQTDSAILEESLRYGHILFAGLMATIYYNMSAGILRALGDSKTPLKAIITSSILNIVLDYFLIIIVKTGVRGAAFATVFSQIISGTICVVAICKIEFLHLEAKDFRSEKQMYLELLKNGVPMAIMNSITAVGCTVVQAFINGQGVAYTSTYAACSRYLVLFMNPANSTGATMSAFASQNEGAREYKRVHQGLRVCLAIVFFFYVTLGSLMVFIPRTLASVMLSSEETLTLACQYLPICGILLFGVDFLFVYRSAVQGLGKPLPPMVSGISEMFFRILVIALFIERIGIRATAYAEGAAWTSALIINVVAYYHTMSRRMR